MTFDMSRHCNSSGQLRVITKKELAKILGISERTIHRWVKAKRLPVPMRTLGGNNGGWLAATLLEWQKNQKGH
ncbi:helix-turn-helix transcriptional regulator [Vibrio natriegens]|uniref:helix-turn-helix transcriptional regulator n=1 Tax=Vibrio natriegens TaxID=691 RepID=UPI001FBB002D|nr:helix-turn-helix domain-containing protein [Vibrio natriegens]